MDFGKGFYVTTFQNQAEKWALRKAVRQKKSAIVNVYDLQNDLNEYKVLSFKSENEKWLDFVCECRKGTKLNLEYDIIIGKKSVLKRNKDFYNPGNFRTDQYDSEPLRIFCLGSFFVLISKKLYKYKDIIKNFITIKKCGILIRGG